MPRRKPSQEPEPTPEGLAIARRIKDLSGRLRIEQKELQIRSGVDQSTVSRLMNGRTADPKSSTAARIATVLGTTVEYLVYGLPPGEELARRLAAEARIARRAYLLSKEGLADLSDEEREIEAHRIEERDDDEGDG